MMPMSTEPLQCIPAVPIKNQIEQIAFEIRFSTPDISTDTWNRYPCELDDPPKCRKDHCHGEVRFFITQNMRRKLLTLFFIREDQNAYVSFNRQLRSLFEEGILTHIDPITIQLKPPLEEEPTERVSYKRNRSPGIR
jgi:hypothetical protein